MKLLELLVQESKKGNFEWPDDAVCAVQDDDGQLCFSRNLDLRTDDGQWVNGKWCGGCPFLDVTSEDQATAIVTREQYEAAMQQPVWDGEGLPPVGCECEVMHNATWQKCKILVHTRIGTIACAVYQTDEKVSCSSEGHFRPIHSKRDEAIQQIAELMRCGSFHADAACVYDAIARGDIPGIKLSD